MSSISLLISPKLVYSSVWRVFISSPSLSISILISNNPFWGVKEIFANFPILESKNVVLKSGYENIIGW